MVEPIRRVLLLLRPHLPFICVRACEKPDLRARALLALGTRRVHNVGSLGLVVAPPAVILGRALVASIIPGAHADPPTALRAE